MPALGKHAQLPSAAVTSFLSARGAYDRSFRTARKCRKRCECVCLSSERLSSRQRFSLSVKSTSLSATGEAAQQWNELSLFHHLHLSEAHSHLSLQHRSLHWYTVIDTRQRLGSSVRFPQPELQLGELLSALPATTEPSSTSSCSPVEIPASSSEHSCVGDKLSAGQGHLRTGKL